MWFSFQQPSGSSSLMGSTSATCIIDYWHLLSERADGHHRNVPCPVRYGIRWIRSQVFGLQCLLGTKHAFIYARQRELLPRMAQSAQYQVICQRQAGIRPTDFDKVLENYNVVVGWPASCFVDEILTALSWGQDCAEGSQGWRAGDVVHVSHLTFMEGSIANRKLPDQRLHSMWSVLPRRLDGQWPVVEGKLTAHFDEHNAYVRKAVLEERARMSPRPRVQDSLRSRGEF